MFKKLNLIFTVEVHSILAHILQDVLEHHPHLVSLKHLNVICSAAVHFNTLIFPHSNPLFLSQPGPRAAEGA